MYSKKAFSITLAKYLLVFVPAIVYFFVVNKYALNIPSQDDYAAILDFLCAYKGAHGADKFYMLFAQHGEHRILSSRIIYVLYYGIAGHINFRHIIFIGNAQLLFILMIMLSFIKKCLPHFWFLPAFVASVCIFDLSNWENADFAMASMQNYGIVFLFLSSLFFYNRGNKNIIWGILLQAICTYSSGNGIIASFFIMLFTILYKDRYKIIAASLVFVICSPLYFYHYVSPPTGHPSYNTTKIIAWFLHFIGNHIYVEDTVSIGIGCAILILLFLLIPANRKLYIPKTHLPIACIAGFLFTSMLVTAIFRSQLGWYIPSRYLIYPHLLVAILFILFLIKYEQSKIKMPVAIIFTAAMLMAYKMNTKNGINGFTELNKKLRTTDYYYPDKEVAKNIASRSCLLTIYCLQKERNQ